MQVQEEPGLETRCSPCCILSLRTKTWLHSVEGSTGSDINSTVPQPAAGLAVTRIDRLWLALEDTCMLR